LEDYYSSSGSGCTSTLALSPTDYVISTTEKYRNCKDTAFTTLNAAACFHDDDCAFEGIGNFTCNSISHECNGDFNRQELYFVQCLIQEMDQSQVATIQANYHMPVYEYDYLSLLLGNKILISFASINDPAFAPSLLEKWRSSDCVSSTQPLDFSSRDYYLYHISPLYAN